MTKSVNCGAICWFNVPPSDNGLSDTLRPAAIVQVLPNPNYDKLAIYFGSYAKVKKVTENTTRSRMIGVIYL